MANLLDLRNKINSTKNTGQITKALEMVSAARQKKANDFLVNSRFLRNGINHLMKEIGLQSNLETEPVGSNNPLVYFNTKTTGKVLVITVMSQRGLCGAMK
jgi:F-type H+-transporting ATPase subunit gamma